MMMSITAHNNGKPKCLPQDKNYYLQSSVSKEGWKMHKDLWFMTISLV
jgi:hypothetical protein